LNEFWNLLFYFIRVYRGNFGGSQPVSMDRKNVEFLAQKPYRVTWKADGTRLINHIT